MNAVGWGEASDSGVGSMLIVVVEERLVGGFPLGFTGVGPGVGPFDHQGPVEPLGFPVRLRPARSGALVLDVWAESFESPRG